MNKFDFKDYVDYESISKSWEYLGDVSDKLYYFKDPIIRNDYLNNDSNCFWLNLSDGIYFFKERGSKEIFFNELLGEKISLFLGLDSVHYELAHIIINNTSKYGLLSKWARKEKKEYFCLSQIIPKEPDYLNKPLEFLNQLERVYKNQPIVNQIRDFLAREYYTMDYDRLIEEIIIEIDYKIVSLGYLSDYENEFLTFKRPLGIPFYYKIDGDDLNFKKHLLKDERLQLSLKKAMSIPLLDLVQELKSLIYVTDYDLQYTKFWQERQTESLKKILSIK